MNEPGVTKILCPTDFSEFSRRAFEKAVALARLHGAVLELVHVFPLIIPMIGDFPYATVIVPLDEKTRRSLTTDLETLAAGPGKEGLAITTSLLEGDPCLEILKRTRSSGSDLIVMGTHGLRGFERWLLGSVAERVLVKAPCSVMTVGRSAEEHVDPGLPFPQKILCAVDLSGPASVTLKSAVRLAKGSKGSLSVLHVIEGLPPKAASGDIVSGLPTAADYRRTVEVRARARFEEIVPAQHEEVGAIERTLVTGRPHEEILRAAGEKRADLIVLGAHEGKPLGVPFIGSTVRHVVRAADCPVLTVRPA